MGASGGLLKNAATGKQGRLPPAPAGSGTTSSDVQRDFSLLVPQRDSSSLHHGPLNDPLPPELEPRLGGPIWNPR